MVVDDDEDIRESIEILLSSRGIRVSTAAEGAEALRLLRGADRPSVILLDLMMPGMNGFDLRNTLDTDPELSGIPVVVITGAGNAARPEQLHAPVLRKPFDFATLMSTVNRFCHPGAGGPAPSGAQPQ
jgi:CheY-like chemotaxis protein